MKKLLVLLVLSILFVAGIAPTSCLAYEPLRVAILPIFNSGYTHDQDTERVIAESLQTRFRMPLDKVITLYDVIPDNEVQLALPDELRNRNKPGKINASVLREIGAKLKTDIVIGAQITDFRAFTFHTLPGDLVQKTDLTIRVVGYDTRDNKFLDICDSQHYYGEVSVMGDSDYLAAQIMEHLINKVPYTWKD